MARGLALTLTLALALTPTLALTPALALVGLEGPEARGGGGVLVRGDDERAVLAR